MSSSYEQSGRIRQKRRTRDQLIAATRDLIAEKGAAPTVEEVAAAASVSRTTAYRYFPNQQALLIAAHPETATTSLLPPDIGNDAEERLLTAVRAFHQLIVDTENQQRTMLLLSLQAGTPIELPLRQGRAIAWFEDALAPLRDRLEEAELHWLSVAIRSAVGIESMVWLIDVVGLSRGQAAALMQWSAQALVHEALADGVPAS
jgi:AcrR family transcriptional regulator